jgi:RNA polymerase sigma-70 factor (ECF subfamily)
METVTDRELLRRAQNHEVRALAEIYDRWSPALYRYAMRLLGEAGLAEECVAETFSRFLAALEHGRGPRDYLQAYLYRIAHNWITDHYRRSAPLTVPLDPGLHADAEAEPPRQVIAELERQQIRAALSQLTPDQRQVIVLKYVEEWDNEAIARALDKPVGAIKALQHRALERLRRILRSSRTGSVDETK